jgi:hypothetical protein
MTVRDLFLILLLAAFGLVLASTCARLQRQGDVERRLIAEYNTLFAYLAALLLELFHHLCELARGRDPGRHGEGAFVAFLSLLFLAVPPILPANMAEASKHGVPFTLGMTMWSVVVEIPGQLPRMPHLALTVRPLSTLTVILVVLALDMAVIVLAVGGVLQGAEARAFGCGAAVVAVADVFAALLTLVRVALDPYREPPAPPT